MSVNSDYLPTIMKLKHVDYYKGYVLGFLFSEDLKHVLLIKKTHPPLQAGKLNGIGGKLTNGESHCSAMYRECHEETNILKDNWVYLKPFPVDDKPCHVFYGTADLSKAKVMTEEELWTVSVERLFNEPWIPVCDQIPLGIGLVDGAKELAEECYRKIYSKRNPSYNKLIKYQPIK